MSTTVQREKIAQTISDIVKSSLHSKQILSLTNAVQGIILSASLAVSAIGSALAMAQGFDRKSATKQVDRLFSNEKIKLLEFFLLWIKYLVQSRTQIMVSLDWTDFDKDGQSTLCLNLITSHGRATPLMWRTYFKNVLKDRRLEYEQELLTVLKALLPMSCQQVILLADRGFASKKFFEFISSLGFDYIIRFKANTNITKDGLTMPAKMWLKKDKAARYIDVGITLDQYVVPSFVCVQDKGMKAAWYLASSLTNCLAREIIMYYGRRFTCEENFRDIKDIRFGMGMSSISISKPERRDRVLIASAISLILITLLGAAGEAIGLDLMFRRKTQTKRTHSLFTQGCFYFQAMVNWKSERFEALMRKYAELLEEHLVFQGLFSTL